MTTTTNTTTITYGPFIQLASVDPGSLFETERGVRAIKSEYFYPDGTPEAILLESGEYAHFPDKRETRVRVIFIAWPCTGEVRHD